MYGIIITITYHLKLPSHKKRSINIIFVISLLSGNRWYKKTVYHDCIGI